MKLIVVAAAMTGCVACAGGAPTDGGGQEGVASRTAPSAPPAPKEFTVAGYTIGEPSTAVEARVPEGTAWEDVEGARRGKVDVTWKDRPTQLLLEVRDGVLYGITIQTSKDEAPIDGVRAWADGLCREVAPEGTRLVSWSAPPSRRYVVPFDKAVGDGATLACLVSRDDKFVFAGAAHDAIIAIVNRGLGPTSKERFGSILQAFVPFDWSKDVHVGDAIQLGAFKYTIDAIVPTDRVGKNPYLRKKATEGATFLVVRYRIENTGNETAAVLASDLVIRDSKSRTFRASSDATTVLAAEEEVDLLLAELQPGIPRKQVAVFEVPDTVLARLDLVIPEKGLLGTDEVVIPLTFFDPG